jgi:hypothetical protein
MNEFLSKNTKLRINFLICRSIQTQRSTIGKKTFKILKELRMIAFDFNVITTIVN